MLWDGTDGNGCATDVVVVVRHHNRGDDGGDYQGKLRAFRARRLQPAQGYGLFSAPDMNI